MAQPNQHSTAKNSEDITSLGRNFDTFRATTDQSIGTIKKVGGTLGGIIVTFLVLMLNTGLGIKGDVGEVKGKVEGHGARFDKIDSKLEGQSSRLDRIEKALDKLVDIAAKAPQAAGDGAAKLERAADRVEALVSSVTRTVLTRFRFDANSEIHGTGDEGEGKGAKLVFKIRLDPLMAPELRKAIEGKIGPAVIVYPADYNKVPEPGSAVAQLHAPTQGNNEGSLDIFYTGPTAMRAFRDALLGYRGGLEGYATFDLGKAPESLR